MTFDPGTQLGHYEIVASLGQGAMGQVFRAKDSRLDRAVAIKILPERLASDAELLGRFEREAKALAALSHPNIVTVFDFGSDSNTHFVVTELLEGVTLRERLKTETIPWEKALEYGIAISEGLSAAHSKGIIHRDLKPENLFITQDERLKILDFGLAHRQVDQLKEGESWMATIAGGTRPGLVLGTLGYMSPEQIRGLPVDARSDIFSFGCVLYEMVYGKQAFLGGSVADTMVAILTEDLSDILESALRIPQELDRVIRYCVEKKPEERYQSARDLSLALRMILSGSGIWEAYAPRIETTRDRRKRKRAKKAIDSLAVLPFASVSLDPDAEYLGDGITESIINILSQIPKLRVMARSTVFRFKGKQIDPLALGKELNVGGILTGRLMQRGTNLNILAELVDARDGAQVWGEQYNVQISDLLDVQREIATKISEKLRIKLIGEEKKKLAKRQTENTEAYRLYLKGRYFWNKRSEAGLHKAIDYFEQAILQDPEYALAYAGLSDAYSMLGGYGYMPPQEAYKKAKDLALKGLELDQTLAEAHTSLATVLYRYDWNWKDAEVEFQKAVQYNYGYATAHHWYGVYLSLLGRMDEAVDEMDRAVELDPLSVVIHWTKGYVLWYGRRLEEALEEYDKALQLDPSFIRVHYDIALAYVQKGMLQEAKDEIRKAALLTDQPPTMSALLGWVYASAGDQQEARKILGELMELSKRQFVSPYHIGLIHVALGQIDEAFQWLERSFEAKEDAVVSFKMNPRLDAIRTDPRFKDLLKRIGLPD
jgi:serine/threonine protein kinase/tetratricopeptide (TPR) repeat protein